MRVLCYVLNRSFHLINTDLQMCREFIPVGSFLLFLCIDVKPCRRYDYIISFLAPNFKESRKIFNTMRFIYYARIPQRNFFPFLFDIYGFLLLFICDILEVAGVIG